jgi:hypothetical protein
MVDELATFGAVCDDALLLELRKHRRDRRQRAVALVRERVANLRDRGLAGVPEDAQDRVLEVAEDVLLVDGGNSSGAGRAARGGEAVHRRPQ